MVGNILQLKNLTQHQEVSLFTEKIFRTMKRDIQSKRLMAWVHGHGAKCKKGDKGRKGREIVKEKEK